MTSRLFTLTLEYYKSNGTYVCTATVEWELEMHPKGGPSVHAIQLNFNKMRNQMIPFPGHKAPWFGPIRVTCPEADRPFLFLYRR